MIKILFLDDSKDRRMWFRYYHQRDDIEIHEATTADEAIESLKLMRYDCVCLDHDLADEHYTDLEGDFEDTGYKVAQFIANELEEDMYPSFVLIHSWNHVGSQKMLSLIEKAGISAGASPFIKGVMLNIGY